MRRQGGLRVKHFEGAHGGSAASFDAEFVEHFLHVLLYGGLRDAEDGRDVGVGLALGDPEKHFGGARREAKCKQRLGGGKVGLKLAIGLLFGPAQARLNGADEVSVGDRLREVIVGATLKQPAEHRFIIGQRGAAGTGAFVPFEISRQ